MPEYNFSEEKIHHQNQGMLYCFKKKLTLFENGAEASKFYSIFVLHAANPIATRFGGAAGVFSTCPLDNMGP